MSFCNVSVSVFSAVFVDVTLLLASKYIAHYDICIMGQVYKCMHLVKLKSGVLLEYLASVLHGTSMGVVTMYRCTFFLLCYLL